MYTDYLRESNKCYDRTYSLHTSAPLTTHRNLQQLTDNRFRRRSLQLRLGLRAQLVGHRGRRDLLLPFLLLYQRQFIAIAGQLCLQAGSVEAPLVGNKDRRVAGVEVYGGADDAAKVRSWGKGSGAREQVRTSCARTAPDAAVQSCMRARSEASAARVAADVTAFAPSRAIDDHAHVAFACLTPHPVHLET